MAKFIWVIRRSDKFPTLIGVNTIVRIDPVTQVNEERGAKITFTVGGLEVEESCAEIKKLIDQAAE